MPLLKMPLNKRSSIRLNPHRLKRGAPTAKLIASPRLVTLAAHLCAASCGAFFCSLPAEVRAQDDDDVLLLDTVMTEDDTHTPYRVSSSPTLVQTHTISTRSAGAASSLADVLRESAELRVSESGGRLQKQTISLHGSASQDVLVTYHGITLNALSHASADLSLIPARLLSAAHIHTNAGSQHYGSGALGGLIELESNLAPQSIEIAASLGTLSDYAIFGRAPIRSDHTLTEIALFADHTKGDFKYIDAQNVEHTRTHNGAWRIGGQFTSAWSTDAVLLEAFCFYSALSREIAGLAEFPDAYKNATDTAHIALASLSAFFAPTPLGQSDATFELSAKHHFSRDNYENPASFLGGRPVHAQYDENRTTLSAKAFFSYAQNYTTEIEFGYEHQRVDTNTLIFNNIVPAENTRHIISIRAEENMAWLDDQLRLFAGIRIDEIINSGPAFSPRIAFSYTPNSYFTLRASTSYANRFPAFDELYIKTESIQGDEDLKLQTSILNDISISFAYSPWFELSITGFYNIHWELIRFIPVTAYLYKAKNLPLSTARGVDITANSNLFDLIELSFGYTYNDSFVNKGSLPIPGIARHHTTARVRIHYGILNAWLQTSYSAKIAQKLSGQYAPKDPFRLDAHVAFTIFDKVTISLDVKNLTNDKSSEDFRQSPLPGTTAMLGIEVIQ